MAVRAPHLHLTLRAFCLGAFVFLGRALEEGDDLPFAFEEHVQRQGPALYEYRPLVRAFVESRANALAKRDDARIALDELLREPAAAIFARAHAGPRPTEEQALFRTVLLSLLISTAEACGGFDWDDRAFERAYAELERSLFGEQRAYAAVAPLVGISVVTQIELGGGIRHARRGHRRARASLARGAGPAARRTSAARSTATACSSSSAGSSPARSRPTRPPSSPTPSPRSGSRPRRRSPPGRCCSSGSTGARSASGRCCRSPRRSRRASRRASTRSAAELTRELLARLALADADARARRGARPLGALALPERAVPVRAAARRARRPARRRRGSCAPPCCSATPARSGARSTRRCVRSPRASRPRRDAEDAVRRSLVETLRHGDRAGARPLARRRAARAAAPPPAGVSA